MPNVESVYDQHADWYAGVVRRHGLIHLQIIPEIMDLVGDVAGQQILDVACGEGVFSRELADKGAWVTGVDLSPKLLAIARGTPSSPAPIYVHDDVRGLSTLADETFHGATCIMALMDIDDIEAVFRSVHRVARRDARFVVVITHPCFESPHAYWEVVDGRPARITTQYLTEGYWRGTEDGVRSRFGAQHRTISTYLNTAIDAGWRLERVDEPRLAITEAGDASTEADHPGLLMLTFQRHP